MTDYRFTDGPTLWGFIVYLATETPLPWALLATAVLAGLVVGFWLLMDRLEAEQVRRLEARFRHEQRRQQKANDDLRQYL